MADGFVAVGAGAFLRLAPRLDDELQASFSRERSLPALRAATA